MRRLVAASAILAVLLIPPLSQPQPSDAVTSISAATTDAQRATSALRFLVGAQKADGSLDGSLGETADLVFGAAAAGYDPASLHGCGSTKTALDFLATASDAAATDAAKTGKALLAVAAAHGDAHAFAGRDLVARLTALYHSTTGAYGDGSTFSQAFAILGLEAAGEPVPAAAVTHLRSLQDTDGSWNFQAAANATAGDTNSTAVALMALAAAHSTASDASAFAYLHTQQLADGGFPYQNSSVFGPPASDPDSDSVVIQALLAAGQDPAAASWSKGTSNALAHLRSVQASNGGFAFPGAPAPDAFTTSQVPAALSGVPYGAAVHWTAGRAVPAPTCPSPTPTPKPSATRTATPRPTAAPTRTPAPTRRPTARPTLRPTPQPTPVPTLPPVEPVVVPTPAPSAETPTPAPTLEPSLPTTPEPIPTASATTEIAGVTAGATPAPAAPAGTTRDGGDAVPAAAVYGGAALLGLLLALAAGWLLFLRPRRS